MKIKIKKALTEFAFFLVMIGVYGALIALCNHWFRLNGWNTKGLFLLLTISGNYVNYKLWRRLFRRLDNNSKS